VHRSSEVRGRGTLFFGARRLQDVGVKYEEAVEHAEEALAVYLETFDELGKSIPEQRRQKQPVSLGVTVRIPIIA
jgi:hypothetical protein